MDKLLLATGVREAIVVMTADAKNLLVMHADYSAVSKANLERLVLFSGALAALILKENRDTANEACTSQPH